MRLTTSHCKSYFLKKSPNIFVVIKSRTLLWTGHVARMEGTRSAFKIMTGKPTEKRRLGWPRRRLEDNIRMDLKEIGINPSCKRDGNYESSLPPKRHQCLPGDVELERPPVEGIDATKRTITAIEQSLRSSAGLPPALYRHGLGPRKLYASVAVPPAPVRVPNQGTCAPVVHGAMRLRPRKF